MMITNPSTSEESSDASSTVTPQPTSMPTPTSTPAACDKMVRYDDKTGIIPNRYVLMLNKHTSQSDIIELVKQLKDLMTTVEENTIKVKEIILAENIKMITVEINQAGLEWVSYSYTYYFCSLNMTLKIFSILDMPKSTCREN